jgi:hypothetical protein
MELQLYITKHYGLKYRSKGFHIRFAVVDMSKASTYPINFLCMLPKQINPKLKQKYKFVELFGKESPQLAQTLLNTALNAEKETDIKEAIRKRLKQLNMNPVYQTKCRLCGKYYEAPKVKQIPHRICVECKQRIYAK